MEKSELDIRKMIIDRQKELDLKTYANGVKSRVNEQKAFEDRYKKIKSKYNKELEDYLDSTITKIKGLIDKLDKKSQLKYSQFISAEFEESQQVSEIEEEERLDDSLVTEKLVKVENIEQDPNKILIWEVILPGISKGLFKKREEALDYLHCIIQNQDAVEFTIKKSIITKEESEDLFKSGANFEIVQEITKPTDIQEIFPNILKSPLEILIEDACKNLNFFRVDVNSLSLKKLNIVELTIRRSRTLFLTDSQFIVLDENGKRDYANTDNVYMPGDEANGLIVSNYIELVVKYLKQYHPNIVIEMETVNI